MERERPAAGRASFTGPLFRPHLRAATEHSNLRPSSSLSRACKGGQQYHHWQQVPLVACSALRGQEKGCVPLVTGHTLGKQRIRGARLKEEGLLIKQSSSLFFNSYSTRDKFWKVVRLSPYCSFIDISKVGDFLHIISDSFLLIIARN